MTQLTASGLFDLPSSSSPQVGTFFDLGTASGLTVANALPAPAFTQVYVFTASGLACPSPALGSPALTASVPATILTPADLIVGNRLDSTVFAQINALTGVGLDDQSELGVPSLGQQHSLGTAIALSNAVPSFGAPALTRIIQQKDLVPAALDNTSVGLLEPVFTQRQAFIATLAIGVPNLGQPGNQQLHQLVAAGLTNTAMALPILQLFTPASQMFGVNLTNAVPVLGAPVIGQTHHLAATGLDIPSVLGAPLATGAIHLGSTQLANAVPDFTTGTFQTQYYPQPDAATLTLTGGTSSIFTSLHHPFDVPSGNLLLSGLDSAGAIGEYRRPDSNDLILTTEAPSISIDRLNHYREVYQLRGSISNQTPLLLKAG